MELLKWILAPTTDPGPGYPPSQNLLGPTWVYWFDEFYWVKIVQEALGPSTYRFWAGDQREPTRFLGVGVSFEELAVAQGHAVKIARSWKAEYDQKHPKLRKTTEHFETCRTCGRQFHPWKGPVADATLCLACSFSHKDDEHDSVHRPKHYTFGKIEVIDVLEDWGLGFHLGNAVKYIARAGRKDPSKTLEDLEKARWYLDRYIQIKKEQG